MQTGAGKMWFTTSSILWTCLLLCTVIMAIVVCISEIMYTVHQEVPYIRSLNGGRVNMSLIFCLTCKQNWVCYEFKKLIHMHFYLIMLVSILVLAAAVPSWPDGVWEIPNLRCVGEAAEVLWGYGLQDLEINHVQWGKYLYFLDTTSKNWHTNGSDNMVRWNLHLSVKNGWYRSWGLICSPKDHHASVAL